MSETTPEMVRARAEASAVRKAADAAQLAAGLDLVKGLAGDIKDILVWMLKAAASNPLLGFVGGVIIADILYKNGIITPVGYAAIMVALGAFDGLALATAIAEATSGSISIGFGLISASKAAPTFDLFSPTAQVLSYGDNESKVEPPQASPQNQSAIMGMLGKLLKGGGGAEAGTELAALPLLLP